VQLAFFQCPSFTAVQQVLLSAKRQLGEILSAVEFLDAESLHMVTTHLPGVVNPLQQQTGSAAGQQQQQDASDGQQQPLYMVVETQGSNEVHDREKLEAFLEVSILHYSLPCLPHRCVVMIPLSIAGCQYCVC
jgi:D-2-hydroxyglutarate dehydrogenase